MFTSLLSVFPWASRPSSSGSSRSGLASEQSRVQRFRVSALAVAGATLLLTAMAFGRGSGQHSDVGARHTLNGQRLAYPFPTPTPTPTPPPDNGAAGTEYDPGDGISVKYAAPVVGVGNIGVSPGETVIFRVNASDSDRSRPVGGTTWTPFSGAGPYKITLTSSAGANFPGNSQFGSLLTGNVNLVVNPGWTGANPITVTATIEDDASPAVAPNQGTTKDPNVVLTWTLVKRAGPAPTGMHQISPATFNQWRPAPAVYWYLMDPEINPPGRPNYEGQSVLETFGAITASGFTMTDILPSWRTDPNHPERAALTTPDKVAAFLWNSGGNSSFRINNQDQIGDQHDGFGDTSPFTVPGLAAGVGYILPQTYSCGGNAIGHYTIERNTTDGTTIQVRKSGP